MNRRNANCCANCKMWAKGCEHDDTKTTEVCDDFEMMEEIELKKCPLCGSKDVVFIDESDERQDNSARWVVRCRNCYCGTILGKYDKKDAASRWNRRAE